MPCGHSLQLSDTQSLAPSVQGLSVVHRESLSLLGPVVPLLRALSGRLKFTVRRHKFNKDSGQAARHEKRESHFCQKVILAQETRQKSRIGAIPGGNNGSSA